MSNFLLYDDNATSVSKIEELLKASLDNSEHNIFTASQMDEANRILETEKIDIAFLDIVLENGNGINYAINIQSRYPNIQVVFVTGYVMYSEHIFDAQPSGFLIKPVTLNKIKRVLEQLSVTDENKNNIRPIKSMLFYEVNEFMKEPSNNIKDDNIIENDNIQKIKEYYKNLKKLYKLKFNEKDSAILEKTIYIHSNSDGFLKQVPFLKVKYNSKIFYLLKNNFKAGYLTEFDLNNGDLYLNENYEDYDKKNINWKKIKKDEQKEFFERKDIAKVINNILKTKEIKPRTNSDYVFDEKTNSNLKSKLAKWVCDSSSIAAKNGYEKYNLPKKYRLIYDENGNIIEKQLFEYVGYSIDSPQIIIAKIMFNPAKEKLYDDSKYVEGYLTESDLNDSEEIYILNPKSSKINNWIKIK